MKIQIDTTNKIIKVEGVVGIKDLFDQLEKLIPKDELDQYSIDCNVTIVNWNNPIIIERHQWPIAPVWPWQPIITCHTDTGNPIPVPSTTGYYNVEIHD